MLVRVLVLVVLVLVLVLVAVDGKYDLRLEKQKVSMRGHRYQL